MRTLLAIFAILVAPIFEPRPVGEQRLVHELELRLGLVLAGALACVAVLEGLLRVGTIPNARHRIERERRTCERAGSEGRHVEAVTGVEQPVEVFFPGEWVDDRAADCAGSWRRD